MNGMNTMLYWWIKVSQRKLGAGTNLYCGRLGRKPRAGDPGLPSTCLPMEDLSQKQGEHISSPGLQGRLLCSALTLELHALGLS